MSDPYGSRDNGHSFAGKYGLANPMVAWLINRGYGELVALTPEEMQHADPAPWCPGDEDDATQHRMVWRGHEWVCYQHDEPIRQHIPPRLQKIPPPPFSWLEVVGKEVDLVYNHLPGEARASWKYVIDGVAAEVVQR